MPLIDALLLDPASFNVWIAFRTDGIKGCGTNTDPYDGSTQDRFDEAMVKIASQFPNQKVGVFLGPGTFITAGFVPGGSNAWQLQPGMKIIGSGRDVTTLKRASGITSGYVLGHDLATAVDDLELCDLTLDCNLQNGSGSGATCGGILVMGSRVRVARVRAIHWGCTLSSGICYVFAVIQANPPTVSFVSNAGIEGCEASAPKKLTSGTTPEHAGTTVLFHSGAKDSGGFQQEDYGLSPYIRNCFGEWDASITGTECRGLSMNWCRGGVVEGNHIYNADYGGPYPNTGTTLDLIVRNNFFKNVKHGMRWPQGGLGSQLAITQLIVDPNDSTLGRATTGSPHGFREAERVLISPVVASPSTGRAFTGYFAIASIEGTDKFKFRLPTTSPGTAPDNRNAQKVFSAGRLIVEGNIIELRQGISGQRAIQTLDNVASIPAPDYIYGDVIIRNNKIRYVDATPPNDATATLIEAQGASAQGFRFW